MIDYENRIINYGDEKYMGMFSDEGNLAVYEIVTRLAQEASCGDLKRVDLPKAVEVARKDVQAFGHTEVWDTEVRTALFQKLNERVCIPNMWIEIDYWLDK